MKHHLVCLQDVGPYKKGALITAEDEIAMIMRSDKHPSFIKRAIPDDEAAPSAPEPEAETH